MKMRNFLVIFGIISSLLMSTGSSTLIDLTHHLSPDIPVYPIVQPFNFTEIFISKEPFWLAFNTFLTSEHVGTHIDAPYHFHPDSWKLNEIPIDRLVAPAVVINISERIDQAEKLALTLDDVNEWERFHGVIPNKSIIFLFSGWDRYWGNSKKYIWNDQEIEKDVRTPGYTPEVAEWLIKNRDIVGLGIDTLSIDGGLPDRYPVHEIGAVANVFNLENVANLSRLPPVGATVYALPINIKDGSGAPARIIASVPDEMD